MRTKQGAAVLQIKALEESGEFTGYGSVFGNVDLYGEIVMPGAFRKSLAEHKRGKTRPKMFWQHDPHSPIGSWVELVEDEIGLLVTGKLNMDVQRGAEAHALLKAGDIDGLSIGYRVVKADEDEAEGVTRLKELKLIEVSVVSLGANDQATVSAVKAAEIDNLCARLAAGDRLTEREWEKLLKEEPFGLSNAEAERAVRVHGLKMGQGEPDEAADFWRALLDAPAIDTNGEPA